MGVFTMSHTTGISSFEAVGKRFSRLLVLKVFFKKDSYNAYAKCRCKCGKIVYTQVNHLRSGKIRSCKCLHKEVISAIMTTHGETKNRVQSVEYMTHTNMMNRCYVPTTKRFEDWGGRGIRVFKPWHSAAVFIKYILKHLGRRPSVLHTLDRIDNSKNYEPGNIRWATPKQQNANRRPMVNRRDSIIILKLIKDISKIRKLTSEELHLANYFIAKHKFKNKYIYKVAA